MSHRQPPFVSSPTSPPIDWDGELDSYRKGTARTPSLANRTPATPPSATTATMMPPAPSPFHRPASPQKTQLPATVAVSASNSSASPISTPSPAVRNPPPVPSQFKRTTSPSITVTPSTLTATPSHSPSVPGYSPSPLHSPSASPTPLTPSFPSSPGATAAPVPATPTPPLSSPPLSFLRSAQLAPVMSELRQVYTPLPAFNGAPHPSPSGVKAVDSNAAQLRVIVTAKRKKERKDREESKQQQQQQQQQQGQPTHTKTPSHTTVIPVSPPGAAADEEKERAADADDDEDEDEDEISVSEEQQRLRLEEDIAHSWVEFIDPKSSTRVYINVRTGETAWQRPAAMDDEQDDEDDRVRRRRRGKESGEEEEEGSVMADELSDLFTLTTIPPARLLSSMRHIDRAVQQMVSKAVNLSPALLTSLSSIHSQLQSSVQSLSALVQSTESSPVEALIAYDTLPWSFTSSAAASSAIDHYRAAAAWQSAEDAAAPPSTSLSSTDAQYPLYLSTIALPAHLRQYNVSVRLHSEDDTSVPRLLNVTVTATDTAVSVLKHALYKAMQRLTGDRTAQLSGPVPLVDDFVLKAVGSEEYMLGERPMFEYEYIRQQMRNNEDVHLVVIKRRPIDPAAQSSAPQPQLAVEYQQKVNPAVVPLTRTLYAALSLRSPLQTMTAFSAYDMHLPFRYKVLAVDHLSPLTLPLLAASSASSVAATSAPAGSPAAAAPVVSLTSFSSITVRSFLFHGTVKLPDTSTSTPDAPFASSLRFNNWVTCPTLSYDSFPRAARIAFMLVGRREYDGKDVLLAWLVKQLVDEGGQVLMGRRELKMWPVKEAGKKGKHGSKGKGADDADGVNEAAIFRHTTCENECDRACVRLTVLFQPFALPVIFPLYPPSTRLASKTISAPAALSKQQQKHLDDLLSKDALHPFTAADLSLLWSQRQQAMKVPHALPTFLLSVSWALPEQRHEAHRLLKEWTPFYSPLSALLLLDVKYADATVREHAVQILRRLPDSELALYLLQLVQCLKYEPYHHSALSAFLVQRAVSCPISIGQPLFWHVKNELHQPFHCERYSLLLEHMLSFSPTLCSELSKQVGMVSRLTKVSEMVQRLKREGLHDAEVEKEYRAELHRLNNEFFSQMEYVLSPLHPKRRATLLVVEKCRYMSSKMVPLWLVFRNADRYTHQHLTHHTRQQSAIPGTAAGGSGAGGTTISSPTQSPHPNELLYMIFKSGDDLRQDILTLQLLRFMDQLWLQHTIDLRLKPYSVVATGVNEHGDGIGLIDVVLNSETTSGIQLNPQYGGGTTGAFKLDPIDQFIRYHNRGNVSAIDTTLGEMTVRAAYDVAVENFVHSCAGYCVATFVLGIGDRHNGNIMVTKRGHLFHIDFGHFLGNFKKKFGVNRERAAFVFTPEMAYVMGGSGYLKSPLFKAFLALSKRAFKVLRTSVNELEMLFLLMSNAGMPELSGEADIMYMRDKLYVEEAEAKAEKKLTKEIDKSLNSSYRRFDNFIHNVKHK